MLENGLPAPQREPDRPVRRDLAADVPLGDADDGAAAKQRPVRLVDPAVGRVGARERDHLLHQPADDRLEAEVAREHVRRLDQRLLAAQPLRVLAQEPRRVDGQPELAGDGLGQRHLAGEPASGLVAVEAEDADDPVEDDDGRGEGGARAEVEERLPVAEGRVGDLLGGLRIVHVTVRRSRAARFKAGSLGATSSTDSTPGAFHSARTGIGSPSSPSRMNERETPTAFAVSSTATRRTVSRSSSERTRRPISAISRSRSTAARSASFERAPPRASAASLASPCTRASSAFVKFRRLVRVAATRTPTTSPSEKSGTKAALFAPLVSASVRLTFGSVRTS